MGDFLGAGSDLEGLYGFDSDRDGFLTQFDSRFSEFQVWIDRNGNGDSERNELSSLAELGIISLSLEALTRSPLNPSIHDNEIVGRSYFERADGSRGELGDVALFIRVDCGCGGSGEESGGQWDGAFHHAVML